MATQAATRCADPSQFNIDMSLIKNTRFGRFNLELRCEAFNVLNHPQFGQPNRTIGNAAVATITSMLTEPGVLHLRHHGAQHPVRGEADLLIGHPLEMGAPGQSRRPLSYPPRARGESRPVAKGGHEEAAFPSRRPVPE